MRSRVPVTLALTVLRPLAAGCSDSPTAPGTGPSGSAPPPTPTAIPSIKGPAVIKLNRFPAGVAVIGLNPTVHQLTVEIRTAGFPAGGVHPARLISGGCAHPGAVVHPLDPLTSDDRSIADTTTTVSDVKDPGIPRTGWSLAVYRGMAAADQGVMVMCGDITNEIDQLVTTAGLGVVVPPGGPDPKAAGKATLSIVGGQLEVVIDVRGLTPGSSHAGQIRRGNCEGEKTVVHPLGTITADATGQRVGPTMLPGVGSIPLDVWFVNVSAPGSIDPILCGNVGQPA